MPHQKVHSPSTAPGWIVGTDVGAGVVGTGVIVGTGLMVGSSVGIGVGIWVGSGDGTGVVGTGDGNAVGTRCERGCVSK